jgi:plasmid stability protein
MTLTIELPDEQQVMLNAKARAQGVSAEEYARQVLAHDLETAQPRRRIWEVIAENMKRVPPEDLAIMPKDGASQIDHYVYGVPKRDL